MDGAVPSVTVTENEQALEFPAVSVAVQVTVVVPIENDEPAAGAQTTEAPLQLSVAEGSAKSTVVEH